MKRTLEYKPLLYTTTIRNPERVKKLLAIFVRFNKQILTSSLAEIIMGELIRYGLYRPMKKSVSVNKKWYSTKLGEFSDILLSDSEVNWMLVNNPQGHKEAGFDKGWASRFATIFDFTKELGFVYYGNNSKIEFSETGLQLSKCLESNVEHNIISFSEINNNLEYQIFLNALVKSQRKNPFVRVLNDNIPLILLLQVITKLNNDNDYNNCGISRQELPLIIFWKDNNATALYKLIKEIRFRYKYNPSDEVIIDICENKIMNGELKKFKPKSIMQEYPDEFIRKMRMTGVISLRGGGRFIDINKKEIEKINYILENYSQYNQYETEKEYFNYMAKIDEKLISFKSQETSVSANNTYLEKWAEFFSFNKLKQELMILSNRSKSSDDLLKFIPAPARLEFLTAVSIKSKYPKVKVMSNYPCDDEGLPTNTAGGNQGDIECFEASNGILIEVTMLQGRSQTTMEIWPIARHLEAFSKKANKVMCHFIAPSIFKDSERQIQFLRQTESLILKANTIESFLDYIETAENLYYEH